MNKFVSHCFIHSSKTKYKPKTSMRDTSFLSIKQIAMNRLVYKINKIGFIDRQCKKPNAETGFPFRVISLCKKWNGLKLIKCLESTQISRDYIQIKQVPES
jgi:hypothetical protein